jgi:hypothetical protein
MGYRGLRGLGTGSRCGPRLTAAQNGSDVIGAFSGQPELGVLGAGIVQDRPGAALAAEDRPADSDAEVSIMPTNVETGLTHLGDGTVFTWSRETVGEEAARLFREQAAGSGGEVSRCNRRQRETWE